MYQVVPGGAGGTITDGMPIKKMDKNSRPLVGAGVIGVILVIAAVTAWCYYIASLRKADLLKTELLDLNKDGFLIRNQAGGIVLKMGFRSVWCLYSSDPKMFWVLKQNHCLLFNDNSIQ